MMLDIVGICVCLFLVQLCVCFSFVLFCIVFILIIVVCTGAMFLWELLACNVMYVCIDNDQWTQLYNDVLVVITSSHLSSLSLYFFS